MTMVLPSRIGWSHCSHLPSAWLRRIFWKLRVSAIMLRKASSLICGPWMPRVEVSSTCGGSTPGAVSVSVPVVSACTHFRFFALAISGGGM